MSFFVFWGGHSRDNNGYYSVAEGRGGGGVGVFCTKPRSSGSGGRVGLGTGL